MKSTNWPYLGVLLLVLANHLPSLLAARAVPTHDTFGLFQAFQYFYGNFYYHGDLAGWMPNGMYGVRADLFGLAGLSAAGYVAALLGCIFGVDNVLLVYKLATLGEHLLLVTGVYLLAGACYRSRVSQVAVSAVAAIAPPVLSFGNQMLGWKLYYLVPLAMYFIVRAFQEKKSYRLWQAGIVVVASMLGSEAYFLFLHAFVFSVVFVCLAAAAPFDLGWLIRIERKNLLWLVAFVAIAVAYCHVAIHMLDGTVSTVVGGRDAESHRVPLPVFLKYCCFQAWPLLHLVTGWSSDELNVFYIGLASLALLVFGAVSSQSRFFWAMLLTGLVMVLLSLGGTSTRLFYLFPGLSFYRHLCIYSYINMFLLLCAGFGLDEFLRVAPGRVQSWSQKINYYHVIALFLALFVIVDLWIEDRRFGNAVATSGLPGARLSYYFVCLRLGLYFAASLVSVFLLRNNYWKVAAIGKWMTAGWIVVFVVDVGSYRYLLHKSMPRVGAEYRKGASVLTRLSPLHYSERRTTGPSDADGQEALRYFKNRSGYPGCSYYTTAYNLLQFDPCFPRFRTDILSQRAHTLITARGGGSITEGFLDDDYVPAEDGWLREALGVDCPKLRLYSRVIWSDSKEEALVKIRTMPRDARHVVVLEAPVGLRTSTGSDDRSDDDLGSVTVAGFSANRLQAHVRVNGNAAVWLVYSDSFSKDWRCSINGRSAPIVKANHAFKAVRVEPGDNEVVFYYAQESMCLRYVLAFFGLGCGMSWIVLAYRIMRSHLPNSEHGDVPLV